MTKRQKDEIAITKDEVQKQLKAAICNKDVWERRIQSTTLDTLPNNSMEVKTMRVAMVKHEKSPKVFWFGVPDNVAENVFEGVQVLCDTRKGVQPGTVICTMKDCDTVKELMRTTGAVFPLKNIVGVASSLVMDAIRTPGNMEKTPPKDEKLAERFLEYYHTGEFNTIVRVSHDMVLKDGYSAYVVAKELGLNYITGLREQEP